jgi:hypothetical protein
MNGPQRRPITPVKRASRSPSPVHASSSTNASQYIGLEAAALNMPRAAIASIEKNTRNVRPQSATFQPIQGVARSVTNKNVQSVSPMPLHVRPGMARIPGSRHLLKTRRHKTRRSRRSRRSNRR